jgi:adenosylcobinamide-phosphate synthase
MAAMALALGVALRKPGVYVLNPQGRAAASADTRAAQVFAAKALGVFVGLGSVVMLLVMWWGY